MLTQIQELLDKFFSSDIKVVKDRGSDLIEDVTKYNI